MVRPNARFKIIFWKKLKFFNRICVFFNFCLFVVQYWVQYRLAWFSMNLITWHSWFSSRDNGGQIRISNMKTFSQGRSFLVFYWSEYVWLGQWHGRKIIWRSKSSKVRRKLICLHLTIISPYFYRLRTLSNYKSWDISRHFMVFLC